MCIPGIPYSKQIPAINNAGETDLRDQKCKEKMTIHEDAIQSSMPLWKVLYLPTRNRHRKGTGMVAVTPPGILTL